jgi:hypothetical protein
LGRWPVVAYLGIGLKIFDIKSSFKANARREFGEDLQRLIGLLFYLSIGTPSSGHHSTPENMVRTPSRKIPR